MKKLANDSLIDEVFSSSIKHAIDSILYASICEGECVTDKKLIREGWGKHTGGSVDWHDCLNIIAPVEIFILQSTPLFALEADPADMCKADPLDFFDGVSLVLADGGGPRIWLDLNYKHGRAVQEWTFKGDWGDESFVLKSPTQFADYLGYERYEVLTAFMELENAIKSYVKIAMTPPLINGLPLDEKSLYFQISLYDINDRHIDEWENITPDIWERFKHKALDAIDEDKVLDSVYGCLSWHEKHNA